MSEVKQVHQMVEPGTLEAGTMPWLIDVARREIRRRQNRRYSMSSRRYREMHKDCKYFRCTAKRKNGERCWFRPVKGKLNCYIHGGAGNGGK